MIDYADKELNGMWFLISKTDHKRHQTGTKHKTRESILIPQWFMFYNLKQFRGLEIQLSVCTCARPWVQVPAPKGKKFQIENLILLFFSFSKKSLE